MAKAKVKVKQRAEQLRQQGIFPPPDRFCGSLEQQMVHKVKLGKYNNENGKPPMAWLVIDGVSDPLPIADENTILDDFKQIPCMGKAHNLMLAEWNEGYYHDEDGNQTDTPVIGFSLRGGTILSTVHYLTILSMMNENPDMQYYGDVERLGVAFN
jgi:hypothetical protein